MGYVPSHFITDSSHSIKGLAYLIIPCTFLSPSGANSTTMQYSLGTSNGNSMPKSIALYIRISDNNPYVLIRRPIYSPSSPARLCASRIKALPTPILWYFGTTETGASPREITLWSSDTISTLLIMRCPMISPFNSATKESSGI